MADRGETRVYRAQPAEQVAQLALLSTIMPHADRPWANRYRWALAIGVVVVMVLSLTGFLNAAVAAGAILLPSVYFLYLLESRVWQSAAGSVVLGAIALPAMLAVLVQIATSVSTWGRQLSGVLISVQTFSPGTVPYGELISLSLVTSIVVVIATNAGPILLARRPMFDDLLDGFTFGVAAGFVYAAVDTVIAFREVFLGPALQSTDPLLWGPVLVQVFLIKPVVYALTAGVAVSVFSGKGEGYDGFSRPYAAALTVAVITLALYWLGLRWLQLWPAGPALAVIWGLIVTATVLLRARNVLQGGLLEKAIQEVRERRRARAGPRTPVDCQECEMPLLPQSAFCASCGVSVRATSAGLEARSTLGAAQVTPGGPPSRKGPVRLSRATTVGIVVSTTLALGGLGLVGGAALAGPDDGSSTRYAEAQFLPVVARRIPVRGAEPVAAQAFDQMSLGASPPVGSASTVVLNGGAAVVPIPTGWTLAAGDGREWGLITRDGSLWVWVQSAATDPELVALEDILRATFEQAVRADARVSDVAVSEARALPPFGLVTNRSILSYRGLFADSMFTSRFQSNLYAGMRSDGTYLLVEVRTYAGSDWGQAVESWYPALYKPVWETFGQDALPTDAAP